jgi:hypothetical protein
VSGPEKTKAHFYRKPDGGYTRPIFSADDLKKLAALLPKLGGPHDQSYGLALLILEYFFGHAWLLKHVLDEPKKGFLGRALGSENGPSIVTHRVRDLAELIVNLTWVKGVEAPFDQLKGGKIESAYAELLVGKTLFRRSVPFRFIWPSGKPRENFDIELVFPNGMAACCDVKSKLETKTFSEKGFRRTLDEARDQLPKGFPCLIFVLIPQAWRSKIDLDQRIHQACDGFFKGTKKIVSVTTFTPYLFHNDGITTDRIEGSNFYNRRNEFGGVEWKLLSGQSDSPVGWTRLVDICAEVSNGKNSV